VVVSTIVDVMLAGSKADTEPGAAVVFGSTDDEDETFVPLEVTGRVVEADTELEDVKVFKELGTPSGLIADADTEAEETVIDTELEDVKELGALSGSIADGDAETEGTAMDTELEDAKVFRELGAASGPIADANEDEDREAGAEGITEPTEDVLEAAGETEEEAGAEVKADGSADGKADGKASGPLEADAMELLETAEEDDGLTSAASS
jgi:hypothetical protein